ncbi:DUF2393 domain-containing protein [Sulfurimonas marina]|uniref:DUF2393 domain-containing protein n=1 Tax=Sulfurimonas marina TaxID=2590551 RepID=A0A7M1AX04_9BACT|nr:DUF2393 domain-containing protein [Sulfurimonas marina]QOP41991.1 DUF2393 domain-containing protein [Sulfurimonas marina]
MQGSKFKSFIDGLITQDYILFGTVLLTFLLLIILAIILRNRLKTAVTLVFLAFCIFIIGPTYGYIQLHKYLFKNKVELISQKKLSFVEAVVVKGKITNLSERDFSQCKIVASAYKVSGNKYRNYIYELKPFKKMSITKDNISKGETQEFKMIVEPFRYQKNYNISLEADCK